MIIRLYKFAGLFPPMKIPRLARINKIPLNHIKEEGCKIFGRISGRVFDTSSSGNIPERRTIQTKQISTISSLVDHNKVSSVLQLENQEDNNGNYAPKNNCTSEITLNVKPLSSILQMPSPASQSTDIYHEKFMPCSRQEFSPPPSVHHQYFTHDQHITAINTYKNLDSESLKHLDMPSTKIEHSKNMPPTKIAPPPRRKKLSSAIQQNTTHLVENKVALTKSSKTKHHAPHPPILSLQPNKSWKNVDDDFNSDKRKPNVQSSPTIYEHTTSELTMTKNLSELYRIANLKVHVGSVDTDSVLTINSPISVGVAKLKKNSAMKHTDSVNIFETNNENAFSDFVDELSFEPVVSVFHDKSCDTETCSRQLILKSKNCQTRQNNNLNCDSGFTGACALNSYDSNHSVVVSECLQPQLQISSFTTPMNVKSSVSRQISTVRDPLNNAETPWQSEGLKALHKSDSMASIYIKENSISSVPKGKEFLNSANSNNINEDVRNHLKLSNISKYDKSCNNKIKITTRSVYIMNLFTV